jgi:hypothetical protein
MTYVVGESMKMSKNRYRRSIRGIFRDIRSELFFEVLWNILTFIPRVMFRLLKSIFTTIKQSVHFFNKNFTHLLNWKSALKLLLNSFTLCNNKENSLVKRDDKESKSTIIFLQRASFVEKKQKIVD